MLYKKTLVEIDQLPNLSHLSFFIKWTQFFIKSTKIGVFYRYGYTDITTFRDSWYLFNVGSTFIIVQRPVVHLDIKQV